MQGQGNTLSWAGGARSILKLGNSEAKNLRLYTAALLTLDDSHMPDIFLSLLPHQLECLQTFKLLTSTPKTQRKPAVKTELVQ